MNTYPLLDPAEKLVRSESCVKETHSCFLQTSPQSCNSHRSVHEARTFLVTAGL